MYVTNLYLFDEAKEKKLGGNKPQEEYYQAMDSRFKLWNLVESMSMSDLLLSKVISFEDKNYEVKGVIPSINVQNSFTKKVYLKECSTKKLKR